MTHSPLFPSESRRPMYIVGGRHDPNRLRPAGLDNLRSRTRNGNFLRIAFFGVMLATTTAVTAIGARALTEKSHEPAQRPICTYTVGNQDTVVGFADKTNTSPRELAELNNLAPDMTIYNGGTLRAPCAEGLGGTPVAE